MLVVVTCHTQRRPGHSSMKSNSYLFYKLGIHNARPTVTVAAAVDDLSLAAHDSYLATHDSFGPILGSSGAAPDSASPTLYPFVVVLHPFVAAPHLFVEVPQCLYPAAGEPEHLPFATVD